MPRGPRIHYPGALYHVMARGNNGEIILGGETQKKKYLDIVALYKEKMDFCLYAYCIMDNHVHLLIQANDVPLAKIMQGIQQVYTQWYNRKNERTGHVFQQRYKSILCDKERYLLELIRYIHNNPVKAELQEGVNYKWSSHTYYTGKKTGSIIDVDYVLGMFSSSKSRALKQYLQFMDQKDSIDYEEIEEFKPEKLPDNKKEIRESKNTSIDEIIEKVCANEGISPDHIVRKTRERRISDIRRAIVILSDEHCDVTNNLLAQKLNLSPSMVSKIRTAKVNSSVREIVSRWEEKSSK